ncbi:MAG: aprataxin-like protein [Cirrosporium novae-zelandiae]|nr:MAG: aprataxin-like protein [Cirrosporium novae-zelandiae]
MSTKEQPEDAIDESEMTGTAEPGSSSIVPQKRNAFSELMAPKPKYKVKHMPKPGSVDPHTEATGYLGRNGLSAYIVNPSKFPLDRVISYNDDFTVINDLFPKSSVHILLLPRDLKKTTMHPFEALEDPDFQKSVQVEVDKLKVLVAKELQRRYGKDSALERKRLEAMDADPPPDVLPEGRDWSNEIISGVHAHPSMNHLHIHVLSKDRVSQCMKHRKHYNSFATPFLVPVEDFPLAENDKRRHPTTAGYLQSDLRCWRCGEIFGNKFVKLKEHLDEEFEEWKKI